MYAYFLSMKLTRRELQILNAIVDIGDKDINLKMIASELGIRYDSLIRIRKMAMQKNGFFNFESFLAAFVIDRLK